MESYGPLVRDTTEVLVYLVLLVILVLLAMAAYKRGGIPLLHGVDTISWKLLPEKFEPGRMQMSSVPMWKRV